MHFGYELVHFVKFLISEHPFLCAPEQLLNLGIRIMVKQNNAIQRQKIIIVVVICRWQVLFASVSLCGKNIFENFVVRKYS